MSATSFRSVRIALAIIIVVGGVSCATQQPVPQMPKYTTESGKACARNCQVTYSQCNLPCGEMVGGATTAQQRKQCLNNCNATLGDCYSTCE